MNGVKAFGLLSGHVNELRSANAETAIQDTLDDRTKFSGANGVGFYYTECQIVHWVSRVSSWFKFVNFELPSSHFQCPLVTSPHGCLHRKALSFFPLPFLSRRQ